MSFLARINVNRLSPVHGAARCTNLDARIREKRDHLRDPDAYNVATARRNIADRKAHLLQIRTDESHRLARMQENEAARIADRQKRDQAALATLTERLRSDYMRTPGTTEAGFQKALPTMLEQHRQREALAGPERDRAVIAHARRQVRI